MKKLIIAFFVAVVLCTVTGCKEEKTEDLFTQKNEIYTYEPIDREKTQLIISKTGNLSVRQLIDSFESKYPDIQVIELDITGGNASSSPVTQWVLNGDLPDIMFLAQGFLNEDFSASFEDLSGYPFVRDYKDEALRDNTYQGELRFLPGPSQIKGIAYNKSLFEQYGWKVPATTDEFIALCCQIREDTEGAIQPFNPNAKYCVEFLSSFVAMTYAGLFASMEDREWLADFSEGKATFEGHMEPLYQLIQKLIDNGILTEEHFTYSATTMGKDFSSGKLAMMSADGDGLMSNKDFSYGFFPYPGEKPEDGYITTLFDYVFGVPKKERSEKVREAIASFLAYASSVEGQKVSKENGFDMSNLKGYQFTESEQLKGLLDAINKGHVFSQISFLLKSPGESFSAIGQVRTQALAMTKGELTVEEAVKEMDILVRKCLEEPAEKAAPKVLAKVPQTMSILEVSFFFSDMFKDTTGADIALVPNNLLYGGNMMKIYKGDFTENHLSVIKPRSYGNNTTLVKVSMTGRQLLSVLNRPLSMNLTQDDGIYGFSGLKCTVAPWKEPGQKLLKVTLADGTKLDESKSYSVAFWDGTVDPELIPAEKESFPGTFEELLKAYLLRLGEIKADDSRIILNWKLRAERGKQ